jgi:hypothetical protein
MIDFSPCIQEIKWPDGYNNNHTLAVSLDTRGEDNQQTIAVLFFAPDPKDVSHFHIELNKDEAQHLFEWLQTNLQKLN